MATERPMRVLPLIVRQPGTGRRKRVAPDRQLCRQLRAARAPGKDARGCTVEDYGQVILAADDAVLVLLACADQRSISPMTMSREPTIAGTSAIRQPRQSSLVTDRLQKELL